MAKNSTKVQDVLYQSFVHVLGQCTGSNFGIQLFEPVKTLYSEARTYAIRWNVPNFEFGFGDPLGNYTFGLRKPIFQNVSNAAVLDRDGEPLACDVTIHDEVEQWQVELHDTLDLFSRIGEELWLTFSGFVRMPDDKSIFNATNATLRSIPLVSDVCAGAHLWIDALVEELPLPHYVCDRAFHLTLSVFVSRFFC